MSNRSQAEQRALSSEYHWSAYSTILSFVKGFYTCSTTIGSALRFEYTQWPFTKENVLICVQISVANSWYSLFVTRACMDEKTKTDGDHVKRPTASHAPRFRVCI